MLKELLLQNKDEISRMWIDRIIGRYPPNVSDFLRKEKNRFSNPVGFSISNNIEKLFDELLGEQRDDKSSEYLDGIIRIRSVQEFSPSDAVSFIFELKGVIRAKLGEVIRERGIYDELLKFETRIDEMGLRAFQVYAKCREDLFEIRSREIRRKSGVSSNTIETGLGE